MSARKIIPIETSLRYLLEAPAFLVPDGPEGRLIVFSPQKKMPMWVHRSVYAYQEKLESMMREGLIEICPARQLHASSYRYLGKGRFECPICKRFTQWGIC